MKSKYFVRGLGVGVLITALLFTGFSMLKSNSKEVSSDKNANKGVVATEQPLESAKPTEAVETTKLPEETMLPQATNEATVVPTDGTATQTPSAGSDVAATQSPVQSGEGSGLAGGNVSQSSNSAPTDASQVVDVVIEGGSGSYEIASIMKSKGLVDDADAFNDYMIARGYDEKVNAGTYQIKIGATYEQIARTITSAIK